MKLGQQYTKHADEQSRPSRLSGPVEVVIRTKAQCRDDPDLRHFSVTDGPAAEECRSIIGRLVDGSAVEQIVAFLKEVETNALLGVASVRMDGNGEVRANPFAPSWLRRLSSDPYIGLLARDDRFRNRALLDGTRLGSALVRAAIEVLAPGGVAAPRIWALVKRDNTRSLEAFGRFAFHVHSRSAECEQEVMVRQARKPLPPVPAADAYRAPCVTEHSLAA